VKQANVIRSLSIFVESPGRYIHWGVLQISVANLTVIGAMVLLFVLALVLPFPSGQGHQSDQERRKQ